MKKRHLVTFNFAEKKKKNAENTTKKKRKEKRTPCYYTNENIYYIF
jgi:hypothetical protein